MERIVFLDTNFVCDTTWNCFFSNLERLKDLSNYVKIIVPDMVIYEREEQIKEKFNDTGWNFIKNLFKRKLDNVSIEDEIERLKLESNFDYEIISLNDPSILYKMKNMALKNVPPFKASTDAWFKDCYIYFTVLEYIEQNPWKEYYFCTNDWDFQKAWTDNANVTPIKNWDEVEKIVLKIDDYLSEKITSYLNWTYWTDKWFSFKYLWKNINENFIIRAMHNDDSREFRIEIEEREIVNSICMDDYLFEFNERSYSLIDWIENLCNSWSFWRTHIWVWIVLKNIMFLSKEDVITIIESWTRNSQLYQLFWDSDVREFFWKLYEFIKNDIDDELKAKFIDLFS